MSVDQAAKRDIPDATVARLPGYLRALGQLTAQDVLSVSSEELAHSAGVSSAKLRKDLSHLGSYGVRGVGYDVAHLTYQISRALGLTHDWPVVIVGMGNLGRALASYGGFATKGFKVVALLDRDPQLVGVQVDELTIQPMAALTSLVTPGEACIGVIATPPASAQEVADLLVAAGVSSILNFAATAIQVPEGVHMRKVDLSTELQILAFHEQQRSGTVPEDLLEGAG
ncbi:redox-sensing transcriptional repressor Rex [Janibacter anophelis]|uniref:redox-sensing transcriptional repressor Rex n=1 Tax=Janibacter anophelis TaxID=319054 RepID=UPI000DEF2E7F|nr:redox-sensing transcriptional repressor Rex [Janibacter anophelis]